MQRIIKIFKGIFSDKQRVITCFCFALFVINTQIKQTLAWDSPIINVSFHSTELIMTFVILSYYRFSDFLKHKWIYIIYSIFGLLVGITYICIRFRTEFQFRYPAVVVMVAGLFMMGICAIRTITVYLFDKRKIFLNIPGFIIWILLMMLMSASAGDYNLYALRFFICLLMLYLTPQTEMQHRSITEGMVAGIILGYCFEFGFCLLFRPYDSIRYLGNFSNPNHNCLFLIFVLTALLGGLLLAYSNKCKKIVKVILYILLGTDLACIYMTSSRSGWLCAFFVFVLYIVFYGRIIGKNVLKHLGVFVMVFLLGLPLTYAAIRYMPLTNPYVKFYYFDNHNFHTVNRDNKYDQSNYVKFEDMLLLPLGRFSAIFKAGYALSEESDTENVVEETVIDNETYITAEEPILTVEESNNPVLIRYTIYKWYFDHLTLRGVPVDKQGFQLSPELWIQDTHNIFLAYGMDYGIPAMILFIMMIIYGEVYCIKKAVKQKSVVHAISAMMIIVSPVVGMLEYAWGYGLISMIIPYFCLKNVVVKTSDLVAEAKEISD